MFLKAAIYFTLFCLTAAHLSASAAGTALYTMADLEALEGSKNYKEFFAHAKDVRPSLRSKLWEKMVASMADQYLKDLQKGLAIGDEQYQSVVEISKWTPLRNDEFYAKKRNKFVLKYLNQCLEGGQALSCYKKMQEFFLVFDKERELGVELVKAFNSSPKGHDLDLWPFAAPMASSAYGEFYCGKEPLYPLISKRLVEKPGSKRSVHKDCLEALAEKAKAGLKGASAEQVRLSYLILEGLGRLDPTERAKHLVTQLLAGFRPSEEKWSQAFHALKDLGKNSTKRSELLRALSKMDRLPDGLFVGKDKKKVLVFTRQLSQNFPEYLDHYTGQCLKWLAGETDFPKGNPTPNCHEYFKLSKAINTSPAPVTKKYDRIMNSWKH